MSQPLSTSGRGTPQPPGRTAATKSRRPGGETALHWALRARWASRIAILRGSGATMRSACGGGNELREADR